MSDILERLDRYAFHAECPFDKEAFELAADEITRLREENAQLKDRLVQVSGLAAVYQSENFNLRKERDALREENARLLEALKPFADVPENGAYGGPMVQARVYYECETQVRAGKTVIDQNAFRAARAAVRKGGNDQTKGSPL